MGVFPLTCFLILTFTPGFEVFIPSVCQLETSFLFLSRWGPKSTPVIQTFYPGGQFIQQTSSGCVPVHKLELFLSSIVILGGTVRVVEGTDGGPLDQIRSGQSVEIKLKLMIKILFGFGSVKSISEELLALALIKPGKAEHKLTIMKCIR